MMAARRTLSLAVLLLALAAWPGCGKGTDKADPAPEPTESVETEPPARTQTKDAVPPVGSRPHGFESGVRALEQRLAAPGAPTIVDVRARDRYDAYHLQDAVWVALHSLKVSGAVRAGPTVVVADGFGDPRVQREVDALAEQGLEITALRGGMAAWCRYGGRTVGACRDADIIEPDLVDAGGPREVLILDGPAGDAAAGLRRAGRDLRVLLIADADGTGYEALRPAALGVKAHVLFVAGGKQALRLAAERRAAMGGRRQLVSRGGGHGDGVLTAPVRAPKGCGCL